MNNAARRLFRMLHEEGPRGIVDALRRRIAAESDNGTSAVDVSHRQAMEWFRRRRDR
ncbi:MAG: hypothetical protein GF418_00310 [Chitinivibrionales bacterium]|nr:hypothetical protein [Chitinivibrionales bacterium]MBD3394042.1 hypothetical protein [Chitinivibrionales bacterium]